MTFDLMFESQIISKQQVWNSEENMDFWEYCEKIFGTGVAVLERFQWQIHLNCSAVLGKQKTRKNLFKDSQEHFLFCKNGKFLHQIHKKHCL